LVLPYAHAIITIAILLFIVLFSDIMNEQNLSNTGENATPSATPPVTPTEATVPSVSAVQADAEESNVTPSTNEVVTTESSHKNIIVRNYAIATLAIALMGGGLWLALESQGRVQTNFLGTFSDRSPVATVNGVKITRAAYQKNREQVIASATQQGYDVTDLAVQAEIDNQAVQTLVNTELLTQEATKRGITVTDEDVQARYDEIVTQVGGVEALTARMTELSLNEAGLRGDIRGELLIQALFAEVIDVSTIEISEAEIEAVYTQVSASQEEAIPLEDVRQIIESNLRLSKEQALVTEYIESLRANASIEVML
jgi:peptidyl-prolyl cis-trans isomerase SurA